MSQTDSPNLRKATVSDAADMAILDDIASGGLARWFWQGAVNQGKSDNAYGWGRSRMMQADQPFGFTNCVVAEVEQTVVGMVTSYLVPKFERDDKWTESVLVPIFELMGDIENHWYVDTLAVFYEFRGRGIGRLLLENAVESAANNNTKNVSLIVRSDNSAAKKLYESCGFQACKSNNYIQTDGEIDPGLKHILMSRATNPASEPLE